MREYGGDLHYIHLEAQTMAKSNLVSNYYL